jgi:outer membrane protein assembly factor BamB
VKARAFAPFALVVTLILSCSRPIKPVPPAVFPLATVWTVAFPSPIEPPLALDERRLYVATRDGQLRALRREDGSELWRAPVPGLVSAAAGTLIVREPEGKVTSLQPREGRVRWSAETGVAGVLPAVIDGDLVFVAGQGLVALDASSGRINWTAEEAAVVTSLPVGAGSRVIVGEADGTLRSRDRARGTSQWTFKTASALKAPAFVDEKGEIFLGTTDRRLLRLSRDKGRPGWRWKVGADVTSPAAVAGSLALFTSFDTTLYALRRGSGKLAWRAGLPSRPLSGPLVAGSTVLVACHENEVVGFSLHDGKAVGNLKLPAEIRTPPLLDQGQLFLGLRDRSVLALKLPGQP